MGRKRSYTPLNVFLNTRQIGQLVRERSGAISFSYDQNWLDWEHRIPVSLSLPLRNERYVGASVMAVFDNLLPDSDPIRRRVAAVYNRQSYMGEMKVAMDQYDRFLIDLIHRT